MIIFFALSNMDGVNNIEMIVEETDKMVIEDELDETVKSIPNEVENENMKNLNPLVKEYLQKTPMCLYILTPCFGGTCHLNYVCSLLATTDLFRKLDIEFHIEFCKNDSLVSRARNNLVARAMNNEKMTHILFIDNDIQWNPEDILKLLVADKHLVGGVYPKKSYNWNRLVDTASIQQWSKSQNRQLIQDEISDIDVIKHKLVDYNVNYNEKALSIKDNLAEVKHVATGFMMIKRSVIRNMSVSFPSTKYTDDVGFLTPIENKYAFALFDCCVEDGRYMSEDWLFCNRWAQMGGEIYIDVTINLTHTGIEDYKGSYLSSLL